jgi:hypothetical protein
VIKWLLADLNSNCSSSAYAGTWPRAAVIICPATSTHTTKSASSACDATLLTASFVPYSCISSRKRRHSCYFSGTSFSSAAVALKMKMQQSRSSFRHQHFSDNRRLSSSHIKSKFFSIFAGFFSTIFGEKSGTFLFGNLRRACPGPLRKLRPELSHIISAGCTHVPLPGLRSKTDLLTLEHGIATGPVNRATFQSAGPRAGILKLEDCTVSVGSSQTNFSLCLCLGQCLATKTKRA